MTVNHSAVTQSVESSRLATRDDMDAQTHELLVEMRRLQEASSRRRILLTGLAVAQIALQAGVLAMLLR